MLRLILYTTAGYLLARYCIRRAREARRLGERLFAFLWIVDAVLLIVMAFGSILFR